MASIVTYDVPEKHRDLKKALFALGYKDQIPGTTCEIIYFPNTTVYHSSKTPTEARDEVQAICKKIQINLERCIATTWSSWSAICGEDFN
jgi:hypothetical protein